MIYPLIASMGVGAIVALVLLLQRNSARASLQAAQSVVAALQARAVDLQTVLVAKEKALDLLRASVRQMQGEIESLAAKSPALAGQLFDRVLDGANPSTGPEVPAQPSAAVAASSTR